jgi:hypothetical protein
LLDQGSSFTPKDITNNTMEASMDVSPVHPQDPTPRRRYQRRGSVTEHTLRAQQAVLASMMGTHPNHPSVSVVSHPCEPIREDSFHFSQSSSMDHVATRRPSSTSTISGDGSMSSLLSASGLSVGSFVDADKETVHSNQNTIRISSEDRMDCS